MKDTVFNRLLTATLLASVLVLAVFRAFPGLDLAISAAMTTADGNFWAGQIDGFGQMNAVIRRSNEAVAVFIVVLTLLVFAFGAELAMGRRNLLYVSATILVGPGIIVNLLFKEMVGRARPETVTEFGGTALFSPVLQISDQCASNCSFTSGEAALTSALVICLLVLAYGQVSRGVWRWIALSGGFLTLLVMVMRVALGRHFASDVIASVLVSSLVALAFYPLLNVGQSRRKLCRRAIRADLAAVWHHGADGARALRRLLAPGSGNR